MPPFVQSDRFGPSVDDAVTAIGEDAVVRAEVDDRFADAGAQTIIILPDGYCFRPGGIERRQAGYEHVTQPVRDVFQSGRADDARPGILGTIGDADDLEHEILLLVQEGDGKAPLRMIIEKEKCV